MDYKTVMVGLALDRPNDACLSVAGDLAERFGARVVGVAASDLRAPMYFAVGDFAQKLLDEEAAAIEKRLSELEADFRAAVEKRATSVEWRSARALPVPYMLQQAMAADIIVVGARAETMVDPCAAPDPSDLVMQAGRPLIVVPSTVQWLDLRSVLVAWKDVRERAGPYSTRCRSWRRQKKSRSRKFPKRIPIAPMQCRGLPTWQRGCAATGSRPARLLPKSPAESANSSTISPPTSAPARSLQAPMVTRASANGCSVA